MKGWIRPRAMGRGTGKRRKAWEEMQPLFHYQPGKEDEKDLSFQLVIK